MALRFRGHLVHEHPHPQPAAASSALPGTRGGDTGWAQPPGGVQGQRCCWVAAAAAGEVGLMFQLCFYLGTRACAGAMRRPPGDAPPAPAGARYHLALPALPCRPARAPGGGQHPLRQRDSPPAPLPGPCPAHGVVCREGGGCGAEPQPVGTALSSHAEAGNTSSQLTHPRHGAALLPLPGSAGPTSSLALNPCHRGRTGPAGPGFAPLCSQVVARAQQDERGLRWQSGDGHGATLAQRPGWPR